jgi:hypothetical protein
MARSSIRARFLVVMTIDQRISMNSSSHQPAWPLCPEY